MTMTVSDTLTHLTAGLAGFGLAMLFACLMCRKQPDKPKKRPHDIYETLRDDEPPQMMDTREAAPHGR